MSYVLRLRAMLRAAAICERLAPGRLVVPNWPPVYDWPYASGNGLRDSVACYLLEVLR